MQLKTFLLGGTVVLLTLSASEYTGAQGVCQAIPTQIFTGTIGPNGLATHQIDLQPCEAYSIDVLAKSNVASNSSISVKVYSAATPTGGQLFTRNFSVPPAWTSHSLPLATDRYGTSWPGTRGAHGLTKYLTIGTTHPYSNFDYEIVVTRTVRAGYNIGGDSLASAPTVTAGTILKGSLHHWETYGQNYRIDLPPFSSIRVTGTVSNASSSYSGSFTLEALDENGVYLNRLVNTSISSGATLTLPTASVYTNGSYTNNTAQTKTVFLKLMGTAVWDFQLTLKVVKLQMYLDVEGDFSAASPQSDHQHFVPGSATDGTSVELPQVVHLIAAYVDEATNQVVPPIGTGSVSFSVTNVSRFKGIAMNASHPQRGDTLPDIVLGSASSTGTTTSISASFDPYDYTARVDAVVWDYAGSATVTAQHGGLNQPPSFRLPRDDGGNWLPDSGWHARRGDRTAANPYHHVNDDVADQFQDADANPTGSGNPSGGETGDGFTRFEEYRGFIVRGEHRRTNPADKDLFIASLLSWPQGHYGTALEFALENLPVEAHYIWGLGDAGSPDFQTYSEYFIETSASSHYGDTDRLRAMNFNFESFSQSIVWPSAPVRQRAVLVIPQLPPPADQLPQNADGGHKLRCVQPSVGGAGPNDTAFLIVDADKIRFNGLNHPADDADNEVKYVVAHEVGHAIHIKHRPAPPNGPPVTTDCDDGANEGTASVVSAMSSGYGGGPGVTDSRTQFDPVYDVPQVRLK